MLDSQIPLIPGWNRETNKQIRRGRTRNMDYRSAGVGSAPVRHVETVGGATLLTGSQAALTCRMDGGVDPYGQSSHTIGSGVGTALPSRFTTRPFEARLALGDWFALIAS